MAAFIDRVTVHLKAGDGGNGCASIRREKFKPLAGPNGGNGGNGGSIVLKATNQVSSLLDYHFSAKKTAENGSIGMGDYKDGKKGADVFLPVPLGTQVKDLSGELIVDLTSEGEEFVACLGGAGGLGNEKVASKFRKAPGFSLLGLPGEEAKLVLELKMLANVALVGFPSAGKSSIIAAISAARPKIADYPFTTLTPNLGIVDSHGFRFTVADVPGLIEGASDGKGLGLEFLRHIERTQVIVHVIDMLAYEPGRNPIDDLKAIELELQKYDSRAKLESPICNRPKIVVLNKTDFEDGMELAELTSEELKKQGYEVFLVSAKTHFGIDEFVNRLGEVVKEELEKLKTQIQNEDEELIELVPLKRKNKAGGDFSVVQKGKRENDSLYWEVVGEKTRKFVLQTDFSNDEAVGYLADRLAKIGVEDELKKLGAVDGDEVRISVKNSRANYLLEKAEDAFVFNYEPNEIAGAEQLYSFRRGEDARLEYDNRAKRATRKEKREELEKKREIWAKAAAEFDATHSGDPDNMV